MAANVLVDASFLVALLISRDTRHQWAATQSQRFRLPWKTCDAVLAETFYMIGSEGGSSFAKLLHRRAVVIAFNSAENTDDILQLMAKYADVPMSFADACLVCMTETIPDPILLTTDKDFRVYRRNNRKAIPCVMPD
jgi:uncharacterized protein